LTEKITFEEEPTMAEMLHDFPFWVLTFEKNGRPTDAGAINTFVGELASQNISDLFVFSHGWNNDRTTALKLYDRFFAEIRKIIDDETLPKKKPAARIGVVGIVWPSILWPDDEENASMQEVVTFSGRGGAASLAGGPPTPVAQATPQRINAELKKGYDAQQQSLIDELTSLLEDQPSTSAALEEFRAKLAQLLGSEPADGQVDQQQPDYAEGAMGALSPQKWHELLDVLGTRAMREQGSSGGAAGFGDPFKKLWSGAKDALRIATYWQMKQRGGIVGREGLGRIVLARLAKDAKNTRVHLLGHSFGARLVSFSLSGLADAMSTERSPVKSLFLLQGAFSHYAFADQLPHDASRSGALKGMATRVDGPLLTTHSLKDTAVGRSYPAASFVNMDDSASAEEQESRWGAMGNRGAQAVDAVAELLAAPGKAYGFAKGKWVNLDGNQVIIHGGFPSGAHSDIVYPHTAWAALAAAAIV
jgi:hypothetical protein